uniref:Uncharacterized protein n=1 Tax=Melanothamnus harveyi TaxID=397005 RepID=A0A1Z1MHI7_MELHR|nr:hypothetical protein [Melanothamnus harveyi]ARW65483.1 hypothetical protein [Melanothamnus harveyi]
MYFIKLYIYNTLIVYILCIMYNAQNSDQFNLINI